MPRINNRVLCFDDIRFFNEGMLDTPFGRISFRQLMILGAFTPPAWLMFTCLAGGMAVKIAASGVIMVAGVVMASWRIKTVSIERLILLALGVGRRMPKRRAAEGEKKPIGAPPVKSSRIHAVVGEAVKIVGVLRDPQTGAPLANRQFSIIVDGRLRYKGFSDESGMFEVVYLPEHPGIVRVEVAPEGYAFSEKIEVTVGLGR